MPDDDVTWIEARGADGIPWPRWDAIMERKFGTRWGFRMNRRTSMSEKDFIHENLIDVVDAARMAHRDLTIEITERQIVFSVAKRSRPEPASRADESFFDPASF